jgi:hypothetical protein
MQPEPPSDHACLLFPTSLQTHGNGVFPTRLADGFHLARFLKVAALCCRGLVIADSDLNNNPIFYRLTAGDTVLRDALGSGLIRRAVRQVQGGRASQRAVGEALKTSNPARFSKIPTGHLDQLDAIFAQQEGTFAPFEWTLAQLGNVFTDKLKQRLIDEERTLLVPEGRALIAAMVAWIDERVERGEGVAAARLEAELGPAGRNPPDEDAWNAVWPLVLETYNGNVPLVMNGSLTEAYNPRRNDLLSPAGANSNPEEIANAVRHYVADFPTDAIQPSPPIHLPLRDHVSSTTFVLNERRLDEMTLRQIIELRDRCEPDGYFRLRFAAIGSSHELAEHTHALTDAAETYAQRLASAGIIMTGEESDLGRLTEQARALLEGGRNSQYFIADADLGDAARKLAVLVSDANPVGGVCVVHCDLTLLRRLGIQMVLREQRRYPIFAFKRPDYRVIQALTAESR